MVLKFETGDMIICLDNNEKFIIIKEHMLFMSETKPRFDIISLATQEVIKNCYLYNDKWIPTHNKSIQFYSDIEEVVKCLNVEIIECNKYLEKRNDLGQVRRPDDPFEFISYTRGKSIGLIIGRDKLNNILNKMSKNNDAFHILMEEIRIWNREWEKFERQEIKKKPKHVDEFIEDLEKKYELKQK